MLIEETRQPPSLPAGQLLRDLRTEAVAHMDDAPDKDEEERLARALLPFDAEPPIRSHLSPPLLATDGSVSKRVGPSLARPSGHRAGRPAGFPDGRPMKTRGWRILAEQQSTLTSAMPRQQRCPAANARTTTTHVVLVKRPTQERGGRLCWRLLPPGEDQRVVAADSPGSRRPKWASAGIARGIEKT